MALKVLSGILPVADRQSGTATITFDGHNVTGNVIRSSLRPQSLGPDGSFKGTPCYIAVPREFKVVEIADFKDHPGNENHGLFDRVDDPTEEDDFTINSNINADRLEIFWQVRSTGQMGRGPVSEIREISYMIIGEA